MRAVSRISRTREKYCSRVIAKLPRLAFPASIPDVIAMLRYPLDRLVARQSIAFARARVRIGYLDAFNKNYARKR